MAEPTFPGLLTDQERINLQDNDTVSPINFVYFKFNTERNIAKSIITLPANSLIHSILSIRVIEPFKSESSVSMFLKIGTALDNRSIGITTLVGRTIFSIWPGQGNTGTDYFKVFQKSTVIYVSVTCPSPLIQGTGIGVLQWLDMNRVEGFR